MSQLTQLKGPQLARAIRGHKLASLLIAQGSYDLFDVDGQTYRAIGHGQTAVGRYWFEDNKLCTVAPYTPRRCLAVYVDAHKNVFMREFSETLGPFELVKITPSDIAGGP